MSPKTSSDQVGHMIKDAMRKILGDAATAVFFKILENRKGLTPTEIANRPEDFSTLLRDFFGSGADAIERYLILTMSHEFGSRFSSRSFLEVVHEIVGGGNESG